MSTEPPPLPTDSTPGPTPGPTNAPTNAPTPDALEAHVRELVTLAELMLGAAYADGRATWPERSAIGATLAEFTGHKHLPEVVSARIQAFDPARFDVAAACARLSLRTADDRVALLKLLSRVTDADARLNHGEHAYLKQIASHIGATADELAPFLSSD